MLLQHGEGLMSRGGDCEGGCGGGGAPKPCCRYFHVYAAPLPPADPEKNRPALLNVAEEHQSSPPWSKTEPDRPECPSQRLSLSLSISGPVSVLSGCGSPDSGAKMTCE